MSEQKTIDKSFTENKKIVRNSDLPFGRTLKLKDKDKLVEKLKKANESVPEEKKEEVK